ncbi:hypothetical protein GCM10022278_24140 [Allohahella marinimesophila]|uniref:Lipase chaperone n=1 Tax=Allohahella marinimesophila TaxID=1054972 RepID=A0ABP7PHZ5_9GAMM
MLVVALLVLGLGLLFVVILFFSRSENTAPEHNAPTHRPQPVEPPTPMSPESAGNIAQSRLPPSTDERLGSKDGLSAARTAAQSGAQLQDADIEHLSDVFRNSVYPSFQDGFQLDRDGRAAIDVFVASMPDGLNNTDLGAVASIIKAQLPAAEAEELAFIITQLYRLEQEETRIMNEGEPVTTMAGQLAAQKRLTQLRDEWFGPELSALLFSETDIAQSSSGDNTADHHAGGANSEDLSEALVQKQAELADIESDWEQRYQKFRTEKQLIVNAGLDQAEKDRQIDLLFRQHYSDQELEAAQAFDRSRD